MKEEQKHHVGCEELRGEDPAEECGQEQLGSLVLAVPPPSQPSLIRVTAQGGAGH